MADVQAAIRTYLLTKTAITDLISQRLYTDALPQGATLPAATMYKVSETHDHALDGLVGMVATRLQFDCFASTRATANAIADAIMYCGIDTLKGVTNSVNIRSVMVEDGQRNYTDGDTSAGDAQRYVTNFDLMVYFLRS